MTTYNWQQPDWPHFRYDLATVEDGLYAIAQKSGLISGKLSHLSTTLQAEAMLNFLVEEAVKTSEIEGEFISRIDVRSSIKNKLLLNSASVRVQDRRAQGVVDMIMSVRDTYDQPLSEAHLFDWHLMLLASSLHANINIGSYRVDEEPMQVVSGHYGKWMVHYEAPPAKAVPDEMKRFIAWFNDTAPGKPGAIKYAPVRAAIAHLYFESIHPFDDGNGRVGRAIAEKALSQGFGYPVILSLSQVIEADKKAYYAELKSASRSNEITAWIKYFVGVVVASQIEVEKQIKFILKKATFFDRYKDKLNERQLKIIQRMLDAGIEGFEGGMSAKKYMAITGASKATATRDLQDLVSMGAFIEIGGGRSVRYDFNF